MKQKDFFSKMKVNFIKGFKNIKSKHTNFLIVALCICLISTAIIWQYTRDNNNGENSIVGDKDEKKSDPIITGAEDPYRDYVEKTMDDYKRALNEQKDSQDQKNNDDENNKDMLESFVKPIYGEISREFNINELIYFEAIEEWRTHQGIDIRPSGDLNVSATYDGVVEKVNTDSTMGVEIIINHGSEILTVYSCLSSSAVNVGDKVQKGQKIGTLGVVENIEMTETPHLHFEIIVKGKNYDPSGYYKE